MFFSCFHLKQNSSENVWNAWINLFVFRVTFNTKILVRIFWTLFGFDFFYNFFFSWFVFNQNPGKSILDTRWLFLFSSSFICTKVRPYTLILNTQWIFVQLCHFTPWNFPASFTVQRNPIENACENELREQTIDMCVYFIKESKPAWRLHFRWRCRFPRTLSGWLATWLIDSLSVCWIFIYLFIYVLDKLSGWLLSWMHDPVSFGSAGFFCVLYDFLC